MNYALLQVGDEVGVRSDNPGALRYFRYERACILEVSADRFRLPMGWFSNVDGRKGCNIVVSLEELEANNAQFYQERQAARYRAEVEQGMAKLGTSPTDLATLERLVQALKG